MSSHNPSSLAAFRVFVIVALATVVLGYSTPDLRRLWQPMGDLGFTFSQNYVVDSVEPHSTAASAGLRIGDYIDIAATTPEYRYAVSGVATDYAGQKIAFAVVRGTQRLQLTIVSQPEAMDAVKKALILLRWFALLLTVGIGVALVLLRPSIATWGFYFYCLGLNGAADYLTPSLFVTPWNFLVSIMEWVFTYAGFVGVAVFGACFLHEPPTGWRAVVYRLAPLVFLIVSCLTVYWIAGGFFGWPYQTAAATLLTLEGVLVVVALVGLIVTYVRSRGTDRQRIRWVIVGFGIALVAFLADDILSLEGNPPYWLYGSLNLVGVVVPLTVAYAVIKHRVIDVSFVVSRALVYAVLTTVLVGIFSLIDWFFTDYVRATRLGTFAEIIFAVSFGLWFNNLHKRVDGFIDGTFFRRRHQAEVQLATDAAALPAAPTTAAVAHFLVSEPVRTLSLASAALFRRDRNGVFVREQSIGWDGTELSSLDDDDIPLLMVAQTKNGPLSLDEHPWRTHKVPGGAARPMLALPILVRRELDVIVFYGSHEHGEALDPDEVRAIASLATGASAAYDHLEADALRKEVEMLRGVIAEAQIQPA